MASNPVATVKPIDRFKREISLRKEMMIPLLPKNISYDKFEAMVIAAVGMNPDLLNCDRASLLKACIQASELGLSLNPTLGEGDILIVKDWKSKSNHAQFRPRYMGLMKLARQSGMISKIEAEVVRENDDFVIEKGDEPRLKHSIKLGKRGPLIGAYCVWTLKDGTKQFEVMDRDQILAIRDRSSAKKDGKAVGPWVTDEEEMWRKTVVRRASKYMPRATDAFVNAVTLDNLHEAGHEVDFADGEIIDITEPEQPFTDFEDITDVEPEPVDEPEAEPEPKPRSRNRALDELAAKVAPQPESEETELHIDTLELVNEDYTDWCARAGEIIATLSPSERKRWRVLHRKTLNEAELMEPEAARTLLALFK